MYYSIKIWSIVVSHAVGNYMQHMQHMGADACMTIQVAMSFISTTFRMVGLKFIEWLLSVLTSDQ